MSALDDVVVAFSKREKPIHFLDPLHCEECAEHDALLRKHTRETISLREVGNMNWNPISFSDVDGFLYYVPALAKLAEGSGDEYFLDQYLIHLDRDERIAAMNSSERAALRDHLEYLRDKLRDQIEFSVDLPALEDVANKLSGELASNSGARGPKSGGDRNSYPV